nr:MAG TPA: hypothetical protein [Caudoviricetes sp.]
MNSVLLYNNILLKNSSRVKKLLFLEVLFLLNSKNNVLKCQVKIIILKI